MFDISPSEEVGEFEIKAKFMGVEMEKVQVHIQVKQTHRKTDTSYSRKLHCVDGESLRPPLLPPHIRIIKSEICII